MDYLETIFECKVCTLPVSYLCLPPSSSSGWGSGEVLTDVGGLEEALYVEKWQSDFDKKYFG